MDLLENYKKAWSNQPEETNKVSEVDIYKMALSKSSSIVKWIFIIGIIEFIVLNSMYFFVDLEEANKEYKKIGLEKFIYISHVLFYVVIFYFLVKFYLNYKKIYTSDSTRVLMKKIIKTRKTVRNYVIFNLVFIALLMVIIMVAEINFNFDEISTKQVLLMIAITLIATLLFLGVLYLFYQLLYGVLLKKLNRNYKELSKLDEN
jgi:hypothetical protein